MAFVVAGEGPLAETGSRLSKAPSPEAWASNCKRWGEANLKSICQRPVSAGGSVSVLLAPLGIVLNINDATTLESTNFMAREFTINRRS